MTMFDDLEVHLAKLSLAAGDVVVLQAKGRITSVAGAQVRAQVSRMLGADTRVIVVDDSIGVSVLKPGPGEVIVLRAQRAIDDVVRARIEITAKRTLGDGVRFLVVDPGIDVSAEGGTPDKGAGRGGHKIRSTLGLPLGAKA